MFFLEILLKIVLETFAMHSTIPIVALAALGMLGIEAASVEVEQPFQKDRVNALNMDGYWYV